VRVVAVLLVKDLEDLRYTTAKRDHKPEHLVITT